MQPVYAKLIPSSGRTQNGFQYKLGINKPAEPFDPNPRCGPGGLYYCDIRDIFEWLDYGSTLCIVRPAPGARVVALPEKFKTEALEVLQMMDMYKVDTWRFLVGHLGDRIRDRDRLGQWICQMSHLTGVNFGTADIIDVLADVDNFKLDVLNSILDYACHYPEDIEMVKYALDKGANGLHAAMKTAAVMNNVEAVELLVAAGARITIGILKSARNQSLNVFRFLVKAAPQECAKTKHALERVASEGDMELAALLLENGARLDVGRGYALGAAVRHRQLEMAAFLIARGADVHARRDYAVRMAAAAGDLDMVKLLVDSGADVVAVDGQAAKLAEKGGHAEVLEYLLSLRD